LNTSRESIHRLEIGDGLKFKTIQNKLREYTGIRKEVTMKLFVTLLNDLWKGSKLVIFDKAGHSPHEEYPEKFNKLALDFLSER